MNRISKLALYSLAAVLIVASIGVASSSMFGVVLPDYMALNNPASGEPTAAISEEPETVLNSWTYTGRRTTGVR